MVNPCLQCNIADKIMSCCGIHPETGESKIMVIGGYKNRVCTMLGEEGLCMSYNTRPGICQENFCDIIQEMDIYELMVGK